MRLRYTEHFRAAYRSLTDEQAKSVQKALRLLAADPRYPSLRVKRIQGTDAIWEARASRSLRITFEMDGDSLTLRNVGPHDEALDSP